MRNDINYKAYQENTAKYIENNLEGKTGGLNPQLRVAKFKKYLNSGKILEIGSGAGFDALELKAQGFNVIASDYVENFVKVLKSKNLSAIQLDIKNEEIDLKDLDGVYINAVLVHFNKGEILNALKKIKNSLKKGGVIFISIIIGKGTEIAGRNKGILREFFYYSVSDIKDLLQTSGFEILELKRIKNSNFIKEFIKIFIRRKNETRWIHVIAKGL